MVSKPCFWSISGLLFTDLYIMTKAFFDYMKYNAYDFNQPFDQNPDIIKALYLSKSLYDKTGSQYFSNQKPIIQNKISDYSVLDTMFLSSSDNKYMLPLSQNNSEKIWYIKNKYNVDIKNYLFPFDITRMEYINTALLPYEQKFIQDTINLHKNLSENNLNEIVTVVINVSDYHFDLSDLYYKDKYYTESEVENTLNSSHNYSWINPVDLRPSVSRLLSFIRVPIQWFNYVSFYDKNLEKLYDYYSKNLSCLFFPIMTNKQNNLFDTKLMYVHLK